MRKGGRKGGSEIVTCLVLSNWCIKYIIILSTIIIIMLEPL